VCTDSEQCHKNSFMALLFLDLVELCSVFFIKMYVDQCRILTCSKRLLQGHYVPLTDKGSACVFLVPTAISCPHHTGTELH
jgi:hypothetical protein